MVAVSGDLPVAAPLSFPARPLRPSRAVYLRRRLVAGGVSLLFLAALFVAASALSRAGGGPLTVTGSGTTPAASRVWIVRPGDTLWTIASTLEPGADVRPLVDRLSAETHGAIIYPGERIPIP